MGLTLFLQGLVVVSLCTFNVLAVPVGEVKLPLTFDSLENVCNVGGIHDCASIVRSSAHTPVPTARETNIWPGRNAIPYPITPPFPYFVPNPWFFSTWYHPWAAGIFVPVAPANSPPQQAIPQADDDLPAAPERFFCHSKDDQTINNSKFSLSSLPCASFRDGEPGRRGHILPKDRNPEFQEGGKQVQHISKKDAAHVLLSLKRDPSVRDLQLGTGTVPSVAVAFPPPPPPPLATISSTLDDESDEDMTEQGYKSDDFFVGKSITDSTTSPPQTTPKTSRASEKRNSIIRQTWDKKETDWLTNLLMRYKCVVEKATILEATNHLNRSDASVTRKLQFLQRIICERRSDGRVGWALPKSQDSDPLPANGQVTRPVVKDEKAKSKTVRFGTPRRHWLESELYELKDYLLLKQCTVDATDIKILGKRFNRSFDAIKAQIKELRSRLCSD